MTKITQKTYKVSLPFFSWRQKKKLICHNELWATAVLVTFCNLQIFLLLASDPPKTFLKILHLFPH